MDDDEEFIRMAIKNKAIQATTTKTIVVITNPGNTQKRNEAIGKIYSELFSEGCLDTESPVKDNEYRKTFVLLTPFPYAIPDASWTIVKCFMGSREKVTKSRMTQIQKKLIEHSFDRSHTAVIRSYGMDTLAHTLGAGLAEIDEKGAIYILHEPQNLLEAFLIGDVFRYITGETSYHDNSLAFMIKKVKTRT